MANYGLRMERPRAGLRPSPPVIPEPVTAQRRPRPRDSAARSGAAISASQPIGQTPPPDTGQWVPDVTAQGNLTRGPTGSQSQGCLSPASAHRVAWMWPWSPSGFPAGISRYELPAHTQTFLSIWPITDFLL